jgi:hypothetical protein
VNRSLHWKLTNVIGQNQFGHLPWRALSKQETNSCDLKGRDFLSCGFSQNVQRICREGRDGSQDWLETKCQLSLLSYILIFRIQKEEIRIHQSGSKEEYLDYCLVVLFILETRTLSQL